MARGSLDPDGVFGPNQLVEPSPIRDLCAANTKPDLLIQGLDLQHCCKEATHQTGILKEQKKKKSFKKEDRV